MLDRNAAIPPSLHDLVEAIAVVVDHAKDGQGVAVPDDVPAPAGVSTHRAGLNEIVVQGSQFFGAVGGDKIARPMRDHQITAGRGRLLQAIEVVDLLQPVPAARLPDLDEQFVAVAIQRQHQGHDQIGLGELAQSNEKAPVGAFAEGFLLPAAGRFESGPLLLPGTGSNPDCFRLLPSGGRPDRLPVRAHDPQPQVLPHPNRHLPSRQLQPGITRRPGLQPANPPQTNQSAGLQEISAADLDKAG